MCLTLSSNGHPFRSQCRLPRSTNSQYSCTERRGAEGDSLEAVVSIDDASVEEREYFPDEGDQLQCEEERKVVERDESSVRLQAQGEES